MHDSLCPFSIFSSGGHFDKPKGTILAILVKTHKRNISVKLFCLFVCVEVLRPSQPNGVMSSAVSLPNHTFTGQA